MSIAIFLNNKKNIESVLNFCSKKNVEIIKNVEKSNFILLEFTGNTKDMVDVQNYIEKLNRNKMNIVKFFQKLFSCKTTRKPEPKVEDLVKKRLDELKNK